MKRRRSERQLRRLIAAWIPVVGTTPADARDPLALIPLLIASALARRGSDLPRRAQDRNMGVERPLTK